MKTRTLTAILAVARDGTIGVNGKLPWHLPADLKRFKALTTGHAVIMGRKTWDSLGKPLPNRHNLVVSQILGKTEAAARGFLVFQGFEAALEAAWELDPHSFVIGGAQAYEALWPRVDRMELTAVDLCAHTLAVHGDEVTRFPCSQWGESSGWRVLTESAKEDHEGIPFQFITLERARDV